MITIHYTLSSQFYEAGLENQISFSLQRLMMNVLSLYIAKKEFSDGMEGVVLKIFPWFGIEQETFSKASSFMSCLFPYLHHLKSK